MFLLLCDVDVMDGFAYFGNHANLWRSPTTARQWQAIRTQWTWGIQAGYTLFAFITTITFAATFTRWTRITSGTLFTAGSLLAGYAIGTLWFYLNFYRFFLQHRHCTILFFCFWLVIYSRSGEKGCKVEKEKIKFENTFFLKTFQACSKHIFCFNFFPNSINLPVGQDRHVHPLCQFHLERPIKNI